MLVLGGMTKMQLLLDLLANAGHFDDLTPTLLMRYALRIAGT